ncbi:integrase, catalytic region, zinc finger, CCHC-type containing protein [Tanacetum coccineum]|uniref:Integrase, catalytic region, zinc finger, CCHC-type containing protein n=1 Tax=Tanacetum coccineum TaxID=301880 RepID=A0ABQ5IX19_9ASTR
MVNTSLKKLKHHLANFDVVVKERTTPTAITEGSWGFKHTKACFRDEIIPFVKAPKDLFSTFNQHLVDELSEVQNVFYQLEQAMEHHIESKTFKVKMNQVLNENERLLEQVMSKDIEKALAITALKDELRKLKGKALVDNDVSNHPSDPEMHQVNMEPITPKLLNKRSAHSAYIKHTQEEAAVLRDLVDHIKAHYPLDSALESAGVDLLTGSQGDNLYTLSLGDMMASSPICLLSKASKTKSWLWHRHLSHLNFRAINHLARHGLVRGLPKLKFEKDHLCSACALGKSMKKPTNPNLRTPIKKNSICCTWICVDQCVSRMSNGKKYNPLVIVDD